MSSVVALGETISGSETDDHQLFRMNDFMQCMFAIVV